MHVRQERGCLCGEQPVVTVGGMCLQKRCGNVYRQLEPSQMVAGEGSIQQGDTRDSVGLPVSNRTAPCQ